MKTFLLEFSYQDRGTGKVESTAKIDATTLPGAVAKGTREFVKKLDRKQKFDMNKNGLEIKAIALASDKESSTERESGSSDETSSSAGA